MTKVQFLHYEDTFDNLLDKARGLCLRQIAFCTDGNCFIYRTANDEYKYFKDSQELRDAIEESNVRAYRERYKGTS